MSGEVCMHRAALPTDHLREPSSGSRSPMIRRGSTYMARRSRPQQGPIQPTIVARQTAALRFPVEVFPSPLRRFIWEVAEALPCPADFVGVPLLAVLGAAIGTSRVSR